MWACISLNDYSTNRNLLLDVVESDNNSELIGVNICNLSGQYSDWKEILVDQFVYSLQSIPTLECVELRHMRRAVADLCILAALQNVSIHTVKIDNASCSPYVIRALLEQKRRVHISQCFMKPNIPEGPASRAAALVESTVFYACNVEELEIKCGHALKTMTQLLNSIQETMSFPALRKLSAVPSGVVNNSRGDFHHESWDPNGFRDDDKIAHGVPWIRLTNIFPLAPLLEEFHLNDFCF